MTTMLRRTPLLRRLRARLAFSVLSLRLSLRQALTA